MTMFSPMKELDIYGVFMPPLLVWCLVSLLTVRVIHGVLIRKGFYHTDLQQQVLDTSLFVILAGLLSFVIS
jgi:hypothetical protein